MNTAEWLPEGIRAAIAFVHAKKASQIQAATASVAAAAATGSAVFIDLSLTDAEHTQMFACLLIAYSECELHTSAAAFGGYVGLLLDAIACANLTREIAVDLLYSLAWREASMSPCYFAWARYHHAIARIINGAPLLGSDMDRATVALATALTIQLHPDPGASLARFQRFALSLACILPDESPVCDVTRPLTPGAIRALDRGKSYYASMSADTFGLHNSTLHYVAHVTNDTKPRDDVRAKLEWLLSAESPCHTDCASVVERPEIDLDDSPYADVLATVMCRSFDYDHLCAWSRSSYDLDPERGNGRFKRELHERFPEADGGRLYHQLVAALTRGQHARVLPSDLVASVAAFLREPARAAAAHTGRAPDHEFNASVARLASFAQASMAMLAARRASPHLAALHSAQERLERIAQEDVLRDSQLAASAARKTIRLRNAALHAGVAQPTDAAEVAAAAHRVTSNADNERRALERAELHFLLHGDCRRPHRRMDEEEEEEEEKEYSTAKRHRAHT